MARFFLIGCIGRDNRTFANPFDVGESVGQIALGVLDELAERFDEDVTSVA